MIRGKDQHGKTCILLDKSEQCDSCRRWHQRAYYWQYVAVSLMSGEQARRFEKKTRRLKLWVKQDGSL